MTARRWGPELVLAALAAGVFLLLQARLLPNALPCAWDPIVAKKALGLAFGRRDLMHDELWISLRGWPIPLMWREYIGPWDIYSLAPFLRLFRDPVLGAQVRDALCGAAGVAAFYGASRAAGAGRLAAALAATALATAPDYQLGAAQGIHCSILLVPIAMACLGAWWSCARGGDDRWAALGLGLTGLGLATRPHFLGFLPGLAWLAWACRGALARLRRERPGVLAAGLAAAALAAAPVLLANVRGAGVTLRFLTEHAVIPRYHNEVFRSNGEYPFNLVIRALQLLSLYDGTSLSLLLFTDPAPPTGTLWLMALPAAFFVWGAARRPEEGGLLLAPLAGFLLLSPVSPTALAPDHMLPLLPIGYLLAARAPGWGRRGALAGGALLAALAFVNAGRTIELGARMGLEEGPWHASRAGVAGLAARLAREEEAAVVLVGEKGDFVNDQLVFVSGGRLRPRALVPGTPPPAAEPGRDALFVARPEDEAEARRAAAASPAARGKAPRRAWSSPGRRGGPPAFVAYRPAR